VAIKCNYFKYESAHIRYENRNRCVSDRERNEREREREREKDKKKDKLKEEKEEREREKDILDDATYADIHARVAMRFTLCTCQSTPAVRMLMTPK